MDQTYSIKQFRAEINIFKCENDPERKVIVDKRSKSLYQNTWLKKYGKSMMTVEFVGNNLIKICAVKTPVQVL